MLDHVGFPITDYKRSKAFYEKALAPLGYSLVMEVAAAGILLPASAPTASPISGSATRAVLLVIILAGSASGAVVVVIVIAFRPAGWPRS